MIVQQSKMPNMIASVEFLGGKLLSTFSTPPGQNGPSMAGRHSFSKPELVLSFSSTGLVGPFHLMPL